ncbi:hypothetical protein NMY22_g13631 [Coprinellus aureogranulatus]|nr:hypothetical protein NMY22_g13631 [Coprinellus aureogranulatus]
MAARNSTKENIPPSGFHTPTSRKRRPIASRSALSWAPPRKQYWGRARQDPLVGHGRHFGRAMRTFCRVHTLLSNGLSTAMQLELGRITEQDLNPSELSEHRLYRDLLSIVPGLEERLNTGPEQDLNYVADMISKGISSARSDDTKSLKSAVVDWITPPNQVLIPPIQRNIKTDRGFHHVRTGELLCPVNLDWDDDKIRRDLTSGQLVPSGDMWPRFLYRHYEYDPDNPWEGLFRSSLLVMAYKHIFTSPSSVYGSPSKATRSSNARIHGMMEVTAPSIAYIATQVRFALSSSAVFSRTDLVTDSEFFYNLIIDLLEDEHEYVEVKDLLKWWNQQIFPAQITHKRLIHRDSVIAKIKARRRRIEGDQRRNPADGQIENISSSSDGEGEENGTAGVGVHSLHPVSSVPFIYDIWGLHRWGLWEEIQASGSSLPQHLRLAIPPFHGSIPIYNSGRHGIGPSRKDSAISSHSPFFRPYSSLRREMATDPANLSRRDRKGRPGSRPHRHAPHPLNSGEAPLPSTLRPVKSMKPDTMKQKRKNRTFEEVEQLETLFAKTEYPSVAEKEALALQLSLTARQVQVWFQNRRAALSGSKKPRVAVGVRARERSLLREPNRKSMAAVLLPPREGTRPGPNNLVPGVPVLDGKKQGRNPNPPTAVPQMDLGRTPAPAFSLCSSNALTTSNQSLSALLDESSPVIVLPCNSFMVGHWRHLRSLSRPHGLLAYICCTERRLSLFLEETGNAFKLTIPYDSIVSVELETPPAAPLASRHLIPTSAGKPGTSSLPLPPSLESATAIIRLSHPPLFHFQASSSLRVWQACRDWSDGRQCTVVPIYQLSGCSGPVKEFVSILLRELMTVRVTAPPQSLLLDRGYLASKRTSNTLPWYQLEGKADGLPIHPVGCQPPSSQAIPSSDNQGAGSFPTQTTITVANDPIKTTVGALERVCLAPAIFNNHALPVASCTARDESSDSALTYPNTAATLSTRFAHHFPESLRGHLPVSMIQIHSSSPTPKHFQASKTVIYSTSNRSTGGGHPAAGEGRGYWDCNSPSAARSFGQTARATFTDSPFASRCVNIDPGYEQFMREQEKATPGSPRLGTESSFHGVSRQRISSAANIGSSSQSLVTTSFPLFHGEWPTSTSTAHGDSIHGVVIPPQPSTPAVKVYTPQL